MSSGSPSEAKKAFDKAMFNAGVLARYHGPSELPAVRAGFLRIDTALAEFTISRSSPFPLVPDHRPESESDPLPQVLEHARGFASSEVTDPSAEIFC